MKNMIKSVFAVVAAMFIGASAWADQTINVEVNGTSKTLDTIETERPSGVTQSQYWGTEKTDADGVIASVSTTGGTTRGSSTTTTIALTGKAGTAMVRVYYARNSQNPTSTSTGATLANTITIKATAAPTYEEIPCGKVNVSLNTTNDLGQAYKKADIDLTKSTVDDGEIAKIVTTADGYVGITGAGRDGEAKVSLMSANGKTQYVYEVSAITITLSKAVKAWSESDHPKYDENNKSNATISIISHILNNPKPKIPNVLFFGTACSAHGLGAEEVCEALNGIREVASVDWYMFLNANEGKKGNGCENYGHIDYQGTKITSSDLNVKFATSEHYTLKSFYTWFQKILTAPATSNAYDYIVIETDGSRLASEYAAETRAGSTKSPYEEQVAKLLKPFYDGDRVIWIMDNGYDYADYITRAGSNSCETNPNKIFAYGDKSDYPTYGDYVVNNVTLKNSGGNYQCIQLLNEDQWKGLLGIYDPTAYLEGGKATNSYTDVSILTSTDKTPSKDEEATTKCARGNPGHTIYYGHAQTIGSTIKGMIKPIEYTTDLADTVLKVQNTDLKDTMTIAAGDDSVRLYKWTKSLTPGPQDDPYADGWVQIPAKDAGITVTGNSISNNVSGITNECYTLLQIDIRIADDFLKTAIAKKTDDPTWPGIEPADDYETSHKWNVNPNDGDAKITVWRGQGGAKVLAQTSAATMSNAWEMQDEEKKLVIESSCVTNVYDGAYHTLTDYLVYEEGDAEKTPILDAIISNSLDKVEWSITNTADFGFVNVTNDAPVYIQAFADGYEPSAVTNATVTILKRPITIVSTNKDKKYDGTPLTLNVEGDADIQVGPESEYDYAPLPDGSGKERFTYTSSASQTEVGSSTATFDCQDGTAKLSNYKVTQIPGTLTINPPDGAINVYSGSETFAYDGGAHANDKTWFEDKDGLLEKAGASIYLTLTHASVTTPAEGEVTNLFESVVISNATDDVTENFKNNIYRFPGVLKVTNAVFSVTATGVNKTYDGVDATATITVDPPKGVGAGEPVIAYRKGATGDFKPGDNNNPVFRDVESADVWYTVSAQYYDTYTGKVANVVSKRPVTIKSQGDQKNYDTFPLEIPDFDITSGSFVPGEGYETYDKATQTEVGATNATFKVRLTGNAKEGNYAITKDETAILKVIAANEIGVTSLDKGWPFDGSAHRFDGTDAYTVTGTLMSGHGVKVEFSDDSTITYPSETPVVNKMSSIIITNSANEDVTAQYSGIVTNNFGKLTITPIPFVGIVAEGKSVMYDGESYAISLTVPEQTPAPKEAPVIGYSEVEGGPFDLAEPPTYSNVLYKADNETVDSYKVYFKVEADGYITTNGFATVTITPRPIHLKSGDDERTYDGEPVSNGVVSVVVDDTHKYNLVNGHTLGDSLAYSSNVNNGSRDNFFKWEIVDANGQIVTSIDTKGNYKVTTEYGKLTVNPLAVSFGFAAKDKVYDGTTAAETTQQDEYTVPTGVTGESLVFDVSEMKFYFDTPNVGDNTVTGEGYSVDSVTVKKGAGAKNPTTDGGVLKANYTLTYIPTAPAKILPRALTNENAIVANNQTMTYGDVPPVLVGEYTGGDNLAEDENLYVDLAYTNTVWDVGEYPDAISTNDLAKAIIVSNGAEDVTANYTIEFKPGTLTVEPKDGRDPKVEVAAVTDTFYYNDYGYQPKPEVTDTAFDPVKTLVEGVDFDYDWLNNTNASEVAKVIVNFKGNYKNSVTNDFKILKRMVTLTSGSDKWTYDGEAHGTNGVTATAYGATAGQEDKTNGEGFVPGEGVTTNGFPTITTVGTKKNDFSYDPIPPQTLADNYTVNAVTGTLEVVASPVKPKTPEEERTLPENPTPENPGDDDPPDDAQVPTLWAPDIAKYYDGKGTNTEAKVFGVDPTYAFTYEYTTNVNHEADEVWSKTLQFTNVLFGVSGEVTSYKVYCRAKDEAGNYVGTNYVAYVTILPAQVTIGPGEDGPVTHPPYGEDPIPPADPENPESWTNGAVSVIKEYDGIPTNIIVEVTEPADYSFVIDYSTNGVDFVNESTFEGYTDPTNRAPVWYSITDPKGNYVPVTNCAFVTIYERAAEVSGGEELENAAELEKDLEENAAKYKTEEHSYVKLRVTVTPEEKIAASTTIRTTAADAREQASAILASASAKAKVSKNDISTALCDLVLERTYDKTAGDGLASGEYDKADWTDIGSNGDNKELYQFDFDYNQPSGYDFIGVAKYHGGSVIWLEKGSNQADCYTIKTKDGKKVLTVWLKTFCLVGPCFKKHVNPPAPKPCPCDPKPLETAWVYQWRFTGKTTKGVTLSAVKAEKGLCGYVGGGRTSACAVRVPASLRIEGYTCACLPCCGSISFETFATANEIFWQKKPFKSPLEGGVSTMISNIIGKKPDQFEAYGTADFIEQVKYGEYTFAYAGIGKYDKKNSRVKSVSGKFAGALAMPWYVSTVDCVPATYWRCDGLALVCPPNQSSVAYGKWSVKYNSSASKKFLNKGLDEVRKAVPQWAR